MYKLEDTKIGVIGLGYVGLPLAVEFGKTYPTVGFDVNSSRIKELLDGKDSTLEVEPEGLSLAVDLSFSNQASALEGCNLFIVTVPTPIDEHKQPDLSPIKAASHTLGKILKQGDIVVYESTVFPGATEDICVPILEAESGLSFNREFFVGYSPERVNPGDKEHRLPNILKVTSGSTPEVADFINELYSTIITAGTHKASSIKVAEAAKVIENTQRDLNIALVNELAIIFNRMEIDTLEVLEAAGSKWNFLPFRPGLVGGHCIGVDPYYLTHKAQAIGHQPEVILSGRRINDRMGAYIVGVIIKMMIQRGLPIAGGRVLILGLTFKENCNDLRNTKVADMVAEFESYGVEVDVHDPWANPEEARHEYGIDLIDTPQDNQYAATVLAVAHREFRQLGAERIRQFGTVNSVLYDVKNILPKEMVDGRL
ncbi:MAG: Vi polysaccharide biosynthesis UDP-N-acetylglucosamine C-6 dehydrogenase TviB [Gammaproteobacteria bacterium]|nr:Vi polysaccharide biosynthesis UDP-N-acetylglucosamine C-6 dehydrogenase TviB [Gammaproteobacteria bacterium]